MPNTCVPPSAVLLAFLLAAPTAAQRSEDACDHDDHPATERFHGAELGSASAPLSALPEGRAPVMLGGGGAAGGFEAQPLAWHHDATNCPAGNARDNVYSPPYEVGIDFIPVTTDDSLAFHVVYSGKSNGSGGVALNAAIYVFQGLDGGILIFGGGYGDPFASGTALNDAAFDVANVDLVVRQCLGRTPANTPVDFVWPHWHGDHGNDEFIHALEDAGYKVRSIAFHQDDAVNVEGYGWNDVDRSKFVYLPDGPCNTPIALYPTTLGPAWFTARSGHTAGSIDLVLDVRGNPNDRFQIRGSVQGTECPTPPDGTQDQVESHNNVVLTSQPQVVRYGCTNPVNSLVYVSGTPRPNQLMTLGVDDPTGTVQGGALTLLLASPLPDPRIPCGYRIPLGPSKRPAELLVDPVAALATSPPIPGPIWTTPGSPAVFVERIPPEAGLIGTSIYLQGYLLNPFASPGRRVGFTDGLELRVR